MRLRNLIPTEKSAVLPHLTYCGTVWHFCKASDNHRLERVQERGLRAVYCDKTGSYDKLLLMAKLPSLHNRRLQDIAILMYKVKNKLSPLYIQDLFCSHDKGHFLYTLTSKSHDLTLLHNKMENTQSDAMAHFYGQN